MQEQESGAPTPSSRSGIWKKLILITAVVVVGGVLYKMFGDKISLDYLAGQEATLRQVQTDHTVLVYGAAFLTYVVVTGLSLPGAVAMTLITGWYFGLVRGVILVSFASTLGATLAFLLSRFILRDTIQARFGARLQMFNKALEREGAFFLFTLRLIPVVPFFVINVVMGLTRIRTWTYWWVSQLGMFAGTAVFVYAGSTIPGLAQLADPSQLRPGDVLSWPRLMTRIGPQADQHSPGGAIRELLNEKSRSLVDELTRRSTEPSGDQTSILLNGLNAALIRPDLALSPAWTSLGQESISPVHIPEDAGRSSERAVQKQLTSINRSIVVAAMPDIISAPQPILSKQMILAFVLLGTFPIIVKRLMARRDTGHRHLCRAS